MYFVLFPIHRIFLVIWFRLILWILIPIWWTRVFYKIFKIRGFWVVLFCIGMDVLGTALGSHDDIAHWAHLGGFIAGMTLALSLLFARQINANGGDLVSVLLGRRAWALIGKPADRQAPAIGAAAAA
jgi:membrane associated rhomboid family serine protease